MTTKDFIDQLIGSIVYVNGNGDLGMNGELRKLIFNKIPLRLIKRTKSGLIYLQDESNDKFYTVPATNISEFEMNLGWIEKDRIAGIVLNIHLDDESPTSPLYDVSSKKLRNLIILGIEEGMKYR